MLDDRQVAVQAIVRYLGRERPAAEAIVRGLLPRELVELRIAAAGELPGVLLAALIYRARQRAAGQMHDPHLATAFRQAAIAEANEHDTHLRRYAAFAATHARSPRQETDKPAYPAPAEARSAEEWT